MMLKRMICVVLSAMLLFLSCGCSSEPEPLRICIDLDVTGAFARSYFSAEEDAKDFQFYLENVVGLTDFVCEFIPASGAERDVELNRIRTEVMAGGGPDVFITHCVGCDLTEVRSGGDPNTLTLYSVGEDSTVELGEALFEMPEKAMELGLFLPLDEYIENAQYAEWDKFTKSVMDAGKNEEGQQLIPLTYSVYTAMYRAEDFNHTPTNMTWEDMLNSEELYDTAARIGDAYNMLSYNSAIESILGELADYKEEKLLFTEEELYQRVTELCELTAYTRETTPYYTKGWSEGSIGIRFNHPDPTFGNRLKECTNGLSENDTLTLVPLYSDDGGCTATILTFAAVNRNTQRPQDAFTVIDYLLATETQQLNALFQKHIFRGDFDASMSMHEELMSSKCPTDQHTDLSDENFAAVCAVRDQITNVEFAGLLNVELEKMTQSCVKAYKNGEDYTDIVHDAYTAMKQMIAE